MGKKNRSKGGQAASAARKEKAAVHKQKEVVLLVSELLEKCSKPAAGNMNAGTVDWDEYMSIYQIVQKIIGLQQADVQKPSNRKKYIGEFMDWMRSHGVDTESVEIKDCGDDGFGLSATRTIEENSLFLRIPRTVMMSTETAWKSELSILAEQDQLLRMMPNVLLALHLLGEKSMPESFWQPYIRTLPSDFTTILYYSAEDMALLKGSPALYDAVLLYRNIARQYAYFHKLFRTFPATKDRFLIGEFCYEDYRWAVSAVMTRQNQIPNHDPTRPPVMALIPLWDMTNHQNGVITTDYHLENDCSECYALQNFSQGEQIRIFYGQRANAEFLAHSGFVYAQNSFDYLAIKLGVSKSDPLGKLKTYLLSKASIPSSQYFPLHTGENPVGTELLTFLRIFSMNEGELESNYTRCGEDEETFIQAMKEEDVYVSKENEMRAWSFLETRTALLLKAYPTTLEEDQLRLDSVHASVYSKLASHLLICEKKILQNAAERAALRKQTVAELLPSQSEEIIDKQD